MPLLNIQVTDQSDPELRRSVALSLTELTQLHLRKDPTLTAIVVSAIAPGDWYIGGQTLADLGVTSFALDIKVTSGTNTKAEMAGYIEAVFAAMQRLLGALHDASYVVVNEVPAAAWGYAGKSQEYRFIAGRIKATA